MAFGGSSPRARLSGLIRDDPTALDVEEDAVHDRRTRRWYGVSAFALVALGLGVLWNQPGLLLASAFGVAFAGYGQLTSPPPLDVEFERRVSDPTPEVGDEVTVTVTARNASSRAVLDLRLVDGVPPGLSVADGSPRHATALRPGGEATFSYTVVASRGGHEFEPATVIARDASGATERVGSAAAETSVACEPSLPATTVSFPLRSQTSQYTGRFPADSGGPGVEFYATREYRPGDPLNRIDWNRTARTGEITTVEYRVERSVTVVLVVDGRSEAYLAPEAHAPSAVERSVEAAGTTYVALTEEDHSVGASVLGPTDCWLEPGNGPQHRVRTRTTLGTHPAFSPDPPSGDTNVYAATQNLKSRLPADSQVVLFSPLCDDRIVAAAVRLDAHGYRTTVVSPDPTATDTAGHRIARVRRRLRIADLRKRAIPVVDWAADEPFERALARSEGRWSR